MDTSKKDNEVQTQALKDLALAKYEELFSKIEAVDDGAVRTVNTDVLASVITVHGAARQYMQFAELAKKLPGFDASCFTMVNEYGLALREAQGRYQAAIAPPAGVAALVAKATEARDLLLSHAQAMAKSGLIEPTRVADVALGAGHRGVAGDLRRLVVIFRDSWKTIGGKTPITLEQLDELGALQNELVDDMGDEQQGPSALAPATVIRQKAYTLFFDAYDQIRRAITFIRWEEGDVDQFAPSLFAGRGGGRQPPQQTQPAQVAPANPPAPVVQSAAVAPGLPGARPFTNG